MKWNLNKIDGLIKCPKTIKVAPTKDMKEENRHRRNDLTLSGNDNQSFRVFLRQSLEFPEDFSVGLEYLSLEGQRIELIRFNGQHDTPLANEDSKNLHFCYHIHKATPERLNEGLYLKHPALMEGPYASFFGAISSFMKETNVANYIDYFPYIKQADLFEGDAK